MFSLDQLFAFVLYMSRKYKIDCSHSEMHSMDVLHYAHSIYEDEVKQFPFIKSHQNIIYTSAILHDMCDKKYLEPEVGLKEIQGFLETQLKPNEIHYTKEIMDTMSYSKVKVNGYPMLGNYDIAYHIVREADLLASYNFDRAIVFDLHRGYPLKEAYFNSLELFKDRVFNYNTNKLFISNYAQLKSVELQFSAINRIKTWNRLIKK